MSELDDYIALSLLPAWCRLRAAGPLSAGRHPGNVLEQLMSEHWPNEPERLERVRQRASAALRRAREIDNPGVPGARFPARWGGSAGVLGGRFPAPAACESGGSTEISAVMFGRDDYPQMLGAIDDPPLVLWRRLRPSRGAAPPSESERGWGPPSPEKRQPSPPPSAPLVSGRASEKYTAFENPAVAIVGSRAASPYAVRVAEKLAADLAEHGVVIVSGLARGVDAASHRGALAGKGLTIAVLGCGVDVIYPPEHASLARSIESSGALVSELVPGTPPRPWCFPMRNRIISGLSRAVVVVEAGEKSGALITARCALEQGREVLAVPGNVLTGRNRGTHGLLRDGAKIVEAADDILEELGMRGAPARPGAQAGSPGTDRILACLAVGAPLDLDSIAERSGLTAARILPRLLELELEGVVARVAGGWVREG